MWWRKNAEIKVDIDLVRGEVDDWIDLDLKLWEWVTLWEKVFLVLFDGVSEGWLFRKSSPKKVGFKFEENFGWNKNKFGAEIRGGLENKCVYRSRWFKNFVLQNWNRRFLARWECSVEWISVFKRFWIPRQSFSGR